MVAGSGCPAGGARCAARRTGGLACRGVRRCGKSAAAAASWLRRGQVEEARKPKFKNLERGRARRGTSWRPQLGATRGAAARRECRRRRVVDCAAVAARWSCRRSGAAAAARQQRGGSAAAVRPRRGSSAAAARQQRGSSGQQRGSSGQQRGSSGQQRGKLWTLAVWRVRARVGARAWCVRGHTRAGGRCGCFRALRVPGGGEGPSGYSEPKASFGPLPRLADATFGVGRCCPPRWQARGRVAGKAGRL